ncbi:MULTISPECIES: HBL/NHE enterotoxin family protein [Bacillus]|uniref:HBL/NHE enterotoxin family protein n=1 Tax=Bacillus TaxID=1386 RepID=UPI00077B0C7C|nr:MULTISPECIES: HBL/NHE enterotoxin family protein [Bacillus cereus group]KXY84374.1 enterotoxin [Bacillus cereus]MBG9937291.1 enterotoxin [Bacillus tropicus]MED2997291.1 HBL/NHE enterotoxin family protein [Bacillus tropicus]OTY57607.1 enterotoxin [Bacillus thuringiensis serovar graciosensis]
MIKQSYKVKALSTVIVVITIGNIFSTHIIAAENTTKSISIHTAKPDATTYVKYSLGPVDLHDAIKKIGSSTGLMDFYALAVLKQANIDFNGIFTVKNPLEPKIIYHQERAKENASQWLHTLKPKIISIHQQIVNYTTRFQNYHKSLLAAIDNKDKETLTNGLTRLSISISENQAEVNRLVESLKEFKINMTEDTQMFKEDAHQLTLILASQDAGIPFLQNQITAFNDAINQYNTLMIGVSIGTTLSPIALIGGSVLIATGAGTPLGTAFIVGGTMAASGGVAGITSAWEELKHAQNVIQKISSQISHAQIQVAGLTNFQNQTEFLTSTIDTTISALQNISDQWHTIERRYNFLLQNIKIMDVQDMNFIKEDLNKSTDNWISVQEYAQKVNTTNIKISNTNKLT